MSGRVNDQYNPQAHSINVVAPRWLPPPPDQLERLRSIAANKNPSVVQTQQDEYSPLLKSNAQAGMSNYNRRNDSYASSSGFNASAGASKGNYTGAAGSNHVRNDRDQRTQEDSARYDPRASNMRASNGRNGAFNRRDEEMPFSSADRFDRRDSTETAARQGRPPSPRTLMTAYGMPDRAPASAAPASTSFIRDRPDDRSDSLRRDRPNDRQRDDDRHDRQRSGDTNWQSKRPRLDDGPSALRNSGRQQDHLQGNFMIINAITNPHDVRHISSKSSAAEEYDPHAPRGRSRSRSPKGVQNNRKRSVTPSSASTDGDRYRPRGGYSKSRQDDSRYPAKDRDVDKSRRYRRSPSIERRRSPSIERVRRRSPSIERGHNRTTSYADRNDRNKRHQQQRKASRSPERSNRRRGHSRSVSPPRDTKTHRHDEYDPKAGTNGVRKWGQSEGSQPGFRGSRDNGSSRHRSPSPPGYNPHAARPDPFYPPQQQGLSARQQMEMHNNNASQGYGRQQFDSRQQPPELAPLQILPPPSVLLNAATRSAPIHDTRPLTIGVHSLPQHSGPSTAPAKKGFRPVGNAIPVEQPPVRRQPQPSEELRRYFSQDEEMAPSSNTNNLPGYTPSNQYSPPPGSARGQQSAPAQVMSKVHPSRQQHVQQAQQQNQHQPHQQQQHQRQQPPQQQQQSSSGQQQQPQQSQQSQRSSFSHNARQRSPPVFQRHRDNQGVQRDSRPSIPQRPPPVDTMPPSPAYQAPSPVESRPPDTPKLSELPAGLPEKPPAQGNAKSGKTSHAPLFPRLVASSNAKGYAGLPSKPRMNGIATSASLPAKPSVVWQQPDKTGPLSGVQPSPSLPSAVSMTASPESPAYQTVSAKAVMDDASASVAASSALQAAVSETPKREDLSRSSTRDHTEKAADEVPPTPTETPAPTPDVHEGKKTVVKINNEFYERIAQVGEGTYGKVYKARNAKAGGLVAMKRIRMEGEKDGFPVTALREIKLLQNLDHPNVIKLLEMMVSKGHVYMVFEYADHDLTGILHHPTVSFTPANLKSLMLQLLHGLDYIHWRGVLHRDLKGSNILLSRNGDLYIADFGLAKFYAKGKRNDYTNRVITQWYKPPELLFGTTVYGPEVDMWSAGCIFLELFTKRPVFQGLDEINQLDTIYKFMGTPRSEDWPELSGLPWYELVKPRRDVPSAFRRVFSPEYIKSPAALDLAEALLSYNPASRPSAYDAALLPYFTEEEPAPEKPAWLADIKGDWHEMESKEASRRKTKELKKQQQQAQANASAGSSK